VRYFSIIAHVECVVNHFVAKAAKPATKLLYFRG
jgi:hypothetical protein